MLRNGVKEVNGEDGHMQCYRAYIGRHESNECFEFVNILNTIPSVEHN